MNPLHKKIAIITLIVAASISSVAWAVIAPTARFGSYGSEGSGGVQGSQFNNPIATAVSASGDIFVLDQGNKRIKKYNSSRVYQSYFGSQGSGNGQFNNPVDIAIDSVGNIYVADLGNYRIQKFNSAGVYQTQFGSQGSNHSIGQFNTIFALRIDSADNIYVLEDNAVIKYNSSGVFQSSFEGGSVSAEDRFDSPKGMVIDSSDIIYIASPKDSGTVKVNKFNTSGVYQSRFTIPSMGMNDPRGMTIDGSDTIYITMPDFSDTTQRIRKYNTNGDLLGTTGTVSRPLSVSAASSSGLLYITYTETNDHYVQVYRDSNHPGAPVRVASEAYDTTPTFTILCDSNETVLLTSAADEVLGSGQCSAGTATITTVPLSVGTQTIYAVYTIGDHSGFSSLSITVIQEVAAPASTGIPSLTTSEFDPTPTFEITCENSAVVSIVSSTNQVLGSGTCSAGNVTITTSALSVGEYQLQSKQRFSASEFSPSVSFSHVLRPNPHRSVLQFGTSGSGDGQFSNPYGITVDPSGNIYVADSGNNRVQKFNSVGIYQSQFGINGSGDGEFSGLKSIVIDSAGNIIALDNQLGRMQKFDANGVYQSQFANGEVLVSYQHTLDSDGNIYVADYANHQVKKFNSDGVFQSQFGTLGSGDGEFNYPYGIDFDPAGFIYVSDSNNNRIQKFTTGGVFVSKFSVSYPYAITVDPAGNIYASNFGNYVTKYDPTGRFLFQIDVQDSVNDMHSPQSGIVYILTQNNVIKSSELVESTPAVTPVSQSVVNRVSYGGGGASTFIPPSTTTSVPSVVIQGYDCNQVTKVCSSAPTITSPSSETAPIVITRNLQVNSKGDDVKTLQKYLNSHGFLVSTKGAGSPGFETTLFGPATRAALIKFQKANNITPAIGFFGPITRSYMK